jgi:hypothetical protein
MDLRIPIDRELEPLLREQAAAKGQDVAAFVLEAVWARVESTGDAKTRSRTRSRKKKILELRKFIDDHRDVKAIADDSRESI